MSDTRTGINDTNGQTFVCLSHKENATEKDEKDKEKKKNGVRKMIFLPSGNYYVRLAEEPKTFLYANTKWFHILI